MNSNGSNDWYTKPPGGAGSGSAKFFRTCASLIHMRFLVPLVAALVPLLITPGLLSYFDVTPKVAILLLGASLSLLYARENLRNVRAILSAPPGRWFVALIAAAWLSSALATVFSSHPLLSFK